MVREWLENCIWGIVLSGQLQEDGCTDWSSSAIWPGSGTAQYFIFIFSKFQMNWMNDRKPPPKACNFTRTADLAVQWVEM